MLACLLGNMVKKYSGDKFVNKKAMFYFYNAVISAVSALCLLIVNRSFELSAFSLLLGIVFGVVTAIQNAFCLKSYEIGPFSYTSVIVSLSTIIPALSGYFLWKEEISFVQIIGIILMAICFVFSVDFTEKHNKTSVLWLAYAFITFITTGLIGVMQKWHQSSDYKGDLDEFLIIAFVVAFVYSMSMFFIRFKDSDKSGRMAVKRDITVLALFLMVIGGVCTATNNKMNLYLSGVMNTAVFFPVVNGGGLVLSTLASLIAFREKFNLQKWIGIIIGIVSVILLCS